MWNFIFGAFLVLHGLVHMLYFGQGQRRFQLQPDMVWPDGSWAFARLFGDKTVRSMASIFLVLAATGFAIGGISVLTGLAWWRPLVVGSGILSSGIYLLFWNGKMRNLPEQGVIAILINLAILAAVLILHWPG